MNRFFVDTNVFVYATGNSRYARGSARVLRAIAGGAAGTCSVAVLEELWHLELSGRIEGLGGATREAYALMRPALAVTDEMFLSALDDDRAAALGANDRLHVATCRAHEIDVIVTADRWFDEVDGLRRVDPSDLDTVEALLTS